MPSPLEASIAALGLSPMDFVALSWFALSGFAYRLVLSIGSIANHSVAHAMQSHRVGWMRNTAVRDNRTLDTILLGGLSQGNAFFASTAVIAVGGLSAMLGSGEKLQVMLERLPVFAPTSAALFEAKILLMIVIFVYAFFKFAWAFRLSHYTAIMIGSMPILERVGGTPIHQATAEACDLHARRTARLIGLAGEHTNAGLRSFYYAIAAMAWFIHPLAFLMATTWVLLILVRREFFSRSLAVLNGRWPPDATRVP